MEALSAPARYNYMESPGEELPFAVIASWTAEHRYFAVEITSLQLQFRESFVAISDWDVTTEFLIVRWVNHFRTTASSLKEKSPGRPRSQRTPARLEEARQALIRSLCHSAVRHVLALRMSLRSLQRIIHDDLKFHSYKIQIVQQLNTTTLADLKERIREALQEIPLDMLHRVMRAFVHRLEECVQCNGNHLPGVIFKKQ